MMMVQTFRVYLTNLTYMESVIMYVSLSPKENNNNKNDNSINL